MILNTGGRTDTVQYYTEWLLRRFAEGYVLTRNPLFPNKVNRYELTPDKVDCVVFCSRITSPSCLAFMRSQTAFLLFSLYHHGLRQRHRAGRPLHRREHGDLD